MLEDGADRVGELGPEQGPGPAPGRGVRLRLSLECVAIFVLGPVVYVVAKPGARALFPALWLWGLACLVTLLLDRGFERRRLWNPAGLRREIGPMLARFALLGGAIVAAVVVFTPERAFGLPRENLGLWLMIMVGYPLFSVYPQEVIFRAFFFRRYAGLFGGSWGLIAASSVVFGFVHIVFGNLIAVPMTLVGGVMFAFTYRRSGSVLAASIEHALYGCLVFTIGLGRYFYSGAV